MIVEKCYNSFRIINNHGEIIRYGGKITEFKNRKYAQIGEYVIDKVTNEICIIRKIRVHDYELSYVVENKDKSYTLKSYENIELIDI